MNATRLPRNVSTAAVSLIAAWSSWSHMVHVALRFGERPEVAYVLPISVDGMLIVASTAMVDDKRRGQQVRWSARLAFAAGVAASMAANIAAAHPSVGARIVAAWPAVALLLVVEMLSRAKSHADPAAQPSEGRGPWADTAAAPSSVDRPTESVPDASRKAVGTSSMSTQDTDKATVRSDALVDRARPAGRGGRAADLVARLRSERPEASLSEIAAKAGVSERHVRRLLTSIPVAERQPAPPGEA